MSSQFEDIPRRIFLDSSTLQTLQDYGGFLYENEPLAVTDLLTMENKLPKNAGHIERTLGLRVLSPTEMWAYLQPWAALFR